MTTLCLVFGHLLLHAKFTLNNYYHYSLKYWPVGAWHFHIYCLSTGQWVLESHNGRRDDSETSPFQSCPTINPKSPQQEWNGRQRSISRVFCRSHRVQMSQISLCKVSQFLAPVSLFRARAKARISIECGSFECGSVRVRGAFVASESLLTAPVVQVVSAPQGRDGRFMTRSGRTETETFLLRCRFPPSLSALWLNYTPEMGLLRFMSCPAFTYYTRS